jgi:hypothetical protein
MLFYLKEAAVSLDSYTRELITLIYDEEVKVDEKIYSVSV